MVKQAADRVHAHVRWVFSTPVFFAWVLSLQVAASAQSAAPLPCVPAASDDPQPWVHNSRVLGSFPPDVPRPRFLGRFHDSNSEHELHIWRDSTGIFGEWLSPVLDADSPVSRLYETQFNATSGSLSFAGRFREAEQRFDGQMRGNVIRGTVKRPGRSKTVVMRKSRPALLGEALRESVTSRAQFECQMILFRRY
jgi:hypothetical protein